MKKLIIAVILLMALATTAQSQPTYIGADGKSVYTDANQSEYEALSPQEKNQAVFTNVTKEKYDAMLATTATQDFVSVSSDGIKYSVGLISNNPFQTSFSYRREKQGTENQYVFISYNCKTDVFVALDAHTARHLDAAEFANQVDQIHNFAHRICKGFGL
jgi:ABC-type oligopeptide transport system substrate-binding subunit